MPLYKETQTQLKSVKQSHDVQIPNPFLLKKSSYLDIRGAYDKFPDFFRMGI